MLRKGEYINNKNEKKSFEKDIEGKVLGIYFSAHWCPPCKMFTPTLCETYRAINDGEEQRFEIVFVSSDQSKEAFQTYFSEMPFLALPYDSELKDELSDYFEIEGIPTLIILDGDGNVITSSGRAVVSGDEKGKKFPWHPEPVEVLDQLSGAKINEEACLIYIPAGDEEAFTKMKEILMPIGKECQEQAKKEDRPQDLYFLVAPPAGNDIVVSLCEFMGIKHDEKALFIADVSSGEIYKSESAEPLKDEVKKFVNDFLDDKLVAKGIRDD